MASDELSSVFPIQQLASYDHYLSLVVWLYTKAVRYVTCGGVQWSDHCANHATLIYRRDDQPVCSACQSPLTVKHFLIECVNFAAIRSRYFSASSMKDVFENVNAQSVIDFIKEINFYHEL